MRHETCGDTALCTARGVHATTCCKGLTQTPRLAALQGEPEQMTDKDWADLRDDGDKLKAGAGEPPAATAPAGRAASKVPPPGFENATAAANPQQQQPQEAAAKPAEGGGGRFSFGGGDAALAALMGGVAKPAPAAPAASAPTTVSGRPHAAVPATLHAHQWGCTQSGLRAVLLQPGTLHACRWN